MQALGVEGHFRAPVGPQLQIEWAIYWVCFRYKGTVRTLYGTGVRIGVQVFVQPSVASYECNAKRIIGFGLVVVEYLYPTGIHFVYVHVSVLGCC